MEEKEQQSVDAQEEVMRKTRIEKAKQAKLRRDKVLASFKVMQTKFSKKNVEASSEDSTSQDFGAAQRTEASVTPPKGGFGADDLSRVACCICSQEKDSPLMMNVSFVVNISNAYRKPAIGVQHGFPLTPKGRKVLESQTRNSLLNKAKEKFQALRVASYHKVIIIITFIWQNNVLRIMHTIVNLWGSPNHEKCSLFNITNYLLFKSIYEPTSSRYLPS